MLSIIKFVIHFSIKGTWQTPTISLIYMYKHWFNLYDYEFHKLRNCYSVATLLILVIVKSAVVSLGIRTTTLCFQSNHRTTMTLSVDLATISPHTNRHNAPPVCPPVALVRMCDLQFVYFVGKGPLDTGP